MLNHEDVLLGERIGRVSQSALVPACAGSVGGQGLPWATLWQAGPVHPCLSAG